LDATGGWLELQLNTVAMPALTIIFAGGL